MKLLGLILLLQSFSAWSDTLVLKEFDQIKLGELLSRLPDSVASKTPTGTDMQITFPIQPQGFQISCTRSFYNGSLYPSYTTCTVTIDRTYPGIDQSYDEIRFNLTEINLVTAIYNAIPYGDPMKEYYSWERDAGTNYEGQSTDVFHYRFECTASNCLIRFSGISTVI